jgi:uncharacterized protein YcbK (DUF882 family)
VQVVFVFGWDSFVPSGLAHTIGRKTLTRAAFRVGLVSLLIVAGARAVQDATADGQTRTLSFHHTHSGEDLTVTFKRSGRYDEAALARLNHFLRDWRSQEQTTMDRRLFDILWEVYRDVDGKQPIQIISSYRSPATNAMLRRRSANSGVARFSQHTQGRAMDFFIPGVALEKIRFAGLRLQRGGVGFYPTSGSPFVHLDTGNIRHWPRMTHDQLARVFPDGRTVHIPSDGRPLAGYQLALADVQRRGDGDGSSAPSVAGKTRTLFASLFGGKQDEDDDAPPAPAGKAAPVGLIASLDARSPTPAATAAATTEAVPLPRSRPAARIQLAAAAPPALPARQATSTAAAPTSGATPRTPADIINARGFWDDMPATPRQASPAQVAALNARRAVGGDDPQSTASIDHGGQALAYAPSTSVIDRAHLIAAGAPIPRSVRARTKADPMAVNKLTTVVAKGRLGPSGRIAISARIAAAVNANPAWQRAMILAASATTMMRATSFGERDMTWLAQQFVKPRITVASDFTDDPTHGLSTQRFSGRAVAALPVEPFAVRTAALR